MLLEFKTLLDGASSTVLSACDNDSGGCDDSGCDVCQSDCESDCDGTAG